MTQCVICFYVQYFSWLECIEEMKMTTAGAYAFVQEYYSQEVEDAVRK